MSGFLVNKSLLDPTVTQYSGGTASFTLPQSGSTNATEVFVGGVPQVAGVDFNISGTALTLTTSAPAGANMVCARQYFSDGITGTPAANSVATSAIQNDSVTGGKLNPALVAGDLIYADGTDTINRLAKGAASQQLAMNSGASAPEWVTPAAGGAWNIIGTSVASSSASLTITGLDSTYDTFALQISDLVPATDSTQLYLRVGDSSGIDSGASDYAWAHTGSRVSSQTAGATGNNFTAQDQSDAQISLASDCSVGGAEQVGSGAGEGVGALLYIHAPGDGTVRPNITGTGGYWSAGLIYYPLFMGGARLAVITLDRVEVLFSSGNIATGRLSCWGIAHA